MAHFASERASFPALLDQAFSIYIVAVPFFYACSGFLLFDRLNCIPPAQHKAQLAKNIRRIVLVYAAWSAIYFAFVLARWWRDGTSVSEVLRYVHTSLVFTTYPTIWFLPALAVALVITYLLTRRLAIQTVFVVSLGFYLIGSVGYSYAFVQDAAPWLHRVYQTYSDVFVTTRNGVFSGFTFVALGALVSVRKERMRVAASGALALASLVLVVVEALVLRLVFANVGADTVFALIPFTYFLLQFLLGLHLEPRRTYRSLRSLSVLVFLSQRLFLTAIPSILPWPVMDALAANAYVGLAAIIAITLGFSVVVLWWSERLRVLRVLY
jgi:serine/alanine racemase